MLKDNSVKWTIIVFRLSIAVVVTGIVVVFFCLPGLVRDSKNPAYFQFLSLFCTGVCICLSLVSLPLESLTYLDGHNSLVSMLISSGLLFTVLLEFSSISGLNSSTSSYSYTAVELDDRNDPLETLPLSDEENHDNDRSNDNGVGKKTKNHGTNEIHQAQPYLKRYFPSAVLIVISIYSFLDGYTLGSHQHSELGNLIRLLSQKSAVALTLGTILEYLEAPKPIFTNFLKVFSLSAPTGIILGSFLHDYNDFSIILYGYSTAVCSGVCLYLAAMHLLPAEMIGIQSNPESSVMKLVALILGFVTTALPSILFDYEHVNIEEI